MHLEIWSDVACPFCYIGKRNLETALETFPQADQVTVRWRSFQLAPDAPTRIEGTQLEHLARKYGRTLEEAAQMQDAMTRMAAESGVEMHFDRVQLTNTYDAHRLLQYAHTTGAQDALKERLLRAYFVEGEHLGEHATLTRLATETGLPEDRVAQILATEDFGAEVRRDIEQAQEFGLQGVPAFVLDRRFGLTGAQPPEVMLQGLQRALDLHQDAATAG
ncbi:DsbA family oxidoreductase [Paraconexibacter sp.]|uniref:DsbA family oxidoreductase n=1 Tax=Paraconexibacter sp. TaxID=2949640 RepID=UPI00356B1BB8